MTAVSKAPTGQKDPDLTIRTPQPEDGSDVHQLIGRCAPLDENSMYCNLLQCSHFAETCALAEVDGEPMGFVSGYLVPQRPERLFIWQVAVCPEARGLKLGKRMILDILRRPVCRAVRELHTTITDDNSASHGVFKSVARSLETDFKKEVFFDEEEHFDGEAATEVLWKIGPFERRIFSPVVSDAA